ncbi:MAG TPA: bL17 family ribosomal protein, partial [Candidatus Binatia bacterium]
TVVQKLFDEVASRFRERPGGYTRVIKLGHRHGDAAAMSVIELTDRGDTAKAEAERKRERRVRRADKKGAPAAPPPGA